MAYRPSYEPQTRRSLPATARLRDLRRQLLDVLRNIPDGPVLLTADSATEAIKLEWANPTAPARSGGVR